MDRYPAFIIVGRRFVLACILVALHRPARIVAAAPDTKPMCSQITDHKVASPNIILLYCADGIPSDPHSLQFTVFSLNSALIQPLPFTITVDKFSADDASWIVLKLVAKEGTKPVGLEGGKKYRLVYRPPSASEDKTVDVDTSASATITLSLLDTNQRIFDLKSHIAFLVPASGSLKLVVREYIGADDKPGFDYSRTGFLAANASTSDIADPGDLGRLQISLAEGITGRQQVAMSLEGLNDIFSQPIKVDPSSRVKLAQAPSTRDAAYYYFKIDYAGGVGAKPAWVFDGKIAPQAGPLIRGWQLAPDLEANVGNGTLSGIKYTDTVDIGGTASRGKRIGNILQYVLTTAGATYETDKEFDRDNMLGTVDFTFNFKNLYEPRKYRTLDKLQVANNDPANAKAKVQLEDIKPAVFGYGMDFHLGLEAGGALVDTTQKATTGPAKIVVPAYSILRPRPQVHAFLEVGTVTFDAKAVGRYLIETENTVQQLSNNTLILRPLNAWQGYFEGNITWTLDPTGHFAANIVYKNGFSPPRFSRVNTVQAGLLIKF
jgi:hypothetical protein